MATDFPGVDEYIDCGSGATLDNIVAKTIALWINVDTIDATVDVMVSKTPWKFAVYTDVGYTKTIILSQPFSGDNGLWISADNAINTGSWYHVAVAYDNSGTANDPIFYANGAVVATREIITPTGTVDADAANSLYIGVIGVGSYFDGRMEDVRFFNRVLSAQEVAILAAGYRGPLGGEVGWWSMSDAQAITAWDGASLTVNTNYLPDMSGNANTGNPTGTPLGIASNCPHMPIWITNLCASAAQVYAQAVSGALTFVGTFGPTTISKAVAGAQTFAGTVNKAIDLAHGFTGAITFVGAVTKRTILHGFEGAITFAGTLTKRISKVVAGAISFVGELLRRKMVPSTITLDASISAGVVTDASVTADVALDSSAEAGVLLRRT